MLATSFAFADDSALIHSSRPDGEQQSDHFATKAMMTSEIRLEKDANNVILRLSEEMLTMESGLLINKEIISVLDHSSISKSISIRD